MPAGDVVAAVDCGTNSVKLLVARVAEDGTLEELHRRVTITRLGRDVDATGRLHDESIRRTVHALADFGAAMEAAGVGARRAVATSATRDAANRDQFLDAAAAVLGCRPEAITGEEEARLSFAGATAGLQAGDGAFLVVDVGGGSTELALGTRAPEHLASMDIGSVRLTEQWLRADPPTPEELSMAVSVARAHVDEVALGVPQLREAGTVVGVGGTMTTIAAVELGTDDRELVHGLRLGRAQVEEVFRTLATEPLAQRRHNPGLHPDRADVVVGGCCVAVAILRHLDLPGLLVSERDLLDAVAERLV